MEVMTRLIDASGTLESIRGFVATDDLQTFLRSFGDTEFEAAAEALQAHARSRSKRRELENALGHLRSAHVAFRKAYTSKAFATLAEEDRAIHMDVITCCVMALCYRHLGEERLVRDYLDHALEAKRHDTLRYRSRHLISTKSYKQSAAFLLRPLHHLGGIVSNPDVSKKQLSEFRDNLLAAGG